MAVQYWVGDFFVDLSRNQITQNKQSQTLAPKALAVLTCLAENQGKVLSQDELLDKVWLNTVVSPNTLQRCIAQLRRALGDDGKVQVFIKTHAKQGYSLECDVRWLDNNDTLAPKGEQNTTVDEQTDVELLVSRNQTSEIRENIGTTRKPVSSKLGLRMISVVAGIIVLGVIGFQSLATKQSSQLSFERLRALTATDDKEFDATYTPDGQYIVFHRYLDNRCGNKLWAKNIKTQQEIQLTQDWGDYGSHSFSKDGKKLVFIETEACTEPVTQRNCYDLVSVDFEKALQSPQQPSVVLQCRHSDVKKPLWLNNNNIALLQKNSDRWKLVDFSIEENKSNVLFDKSDGNIIDYAYSVEDDLLAVISIHNDDQHYIEMIKPDGSILSSNLIQRPQEVPNFRPIYPNFDPVNKQLLFSTGRQLFTLSYEGKVAKINLPFSEKMDRPEFHPNGKSLLMIKGLYDSDIALIQLPSEARNQFVETSLTGLDLTQAYPSFERSNHGEDNAIFQPGGELIAFMSGRSGEDQLWISGSDGPQQLSNFPMDTYILGLEWAEDGKSLLVNANSVLTQVFLDSKQKSFPLQHSIVRLHQWDSKNNNALAIVLIEGKLKLVEYNLNNSEFREVTDKPVLWAGRGDDGRVIYKDRLGQFWQPGPAEAQLVNPLKNQGGKSKSFVVKGNTVFAINDKNQLWSYDLDEGSFEVLREVSEDVDYLTDISQTQVLIKMHVSERKEVVELSFGE